KPKDALMHLNLGNALYQKRLWDQAIAKYREVIQLKPDCADAHFYLGNALYHNTLPDEAVARYRDAVTLYQKLVAKSPNAHDLNLLGQALNNHALILMDRGQLVEARQLLERAIQHQKAALQITPRDPGYLRDLGNHNWGLAETLVRLKEHGAAARTAA